MFGELQCPGPTNASTCSRNFGTTDLAPLSSRNKSARQRATPSSAKSTGLGSPAAQPPRARPAPRGHHRSFGPARPQKTSARGHAHAGPLRRPPCRTKPMRRAALPELGPAPEIPVTVQTLTERSCRWPEGDPKLPGFHFCGRLKTESPGPYCGAHAAIAFR